MPRKFSPPPQVSDLDMHHGTCVTHVPWCMLGSLMSGFLWSRWRGKRSRHSLRMRNPQFYVSGKRPIANVLDILQHCTKPSIWHLQKEEMDATSTRRSCSCHASQFIAALYVHPTFIYAATAYGADSVSAFYLNDPKTNIWIYHMYYYIYILYIKY